MSILNNRIFWCGFVLTFILPSSAYAVKNCIFSEEAISEKSYLNKPSIAISQWFPKSNEVKGVLSNRNLFSVKNWSCNHYGKQAIMIIGPQMQLIPSKLNDQVLYLAEIVLNEAELKQLAQTIKDKPINLSDSPKRIRIPSDEFDEFYIQIDVIAEVIFIEIKLYKT